LSEKNITEQNESLPLAFTVNDKGLPEAVFMLRKRLYIKAKQEPKFRFYTLYDRIYRLRDSPGSPHQTQHADFPHCAFLLSSHFGYRK